MKLIPELKAYIKQNENKKLSGIALHKASASLSMLESTDLLINEYYLESDETKASILLDIFGLLQGFFVSIDALYDLGVSITKYKYHVNINLNKALRELKFIRNDIVGHPTNRTYPNGSIGFSSFKESGFSRYSISYQTYHYENNRLSIKERSVDLKELKNAFFEERDAIINDLYNFLYHGKEESFSKQIYSLYLRVTGNEKINRSQIEEIKVSFIGSKGLKDNSKHRFIWRLNLINTIIDWHESDKRLNDLVNYLLKSQLIKIYKISLETENVEKTIPKASPLPGLLKDFYRFIKHNESRAYDYLADLNDSGHPFFKSDIEGLLSLNPPDSVRMLLNWLLNTQDPDKVFLIGSALNEYTKK